MKVLVVEAVVGVDMDVGVVVMVDTDVILPMMRTHSTTVLYLLVKVHLKMETVESPLKGVAMVALDLTVVVAVVVSVMGKLEMGSDLAGCMNVAVGPDTGKKFCLNLA